MGETHSEHGVKTVFLETFGCQMNDNDSGRLLSFLKDIRYIRTDTPEGADLILLNTCSIRDKAEQKVYSALGRFRELKRAKPGLIIGVGGCVAQQEGATLLKRAPHLDLVFGPHNIHKIKDLIFEAEKERRVVATDFSASIGEDEYAAMPEPDGARAFVSIMRGCDNFCTYCIVPYTRGREVSRDSVDIVDEVKRLVDAGVMEVTLIGQNVNSYGSSDGVSFPGLIRMVAGVDGVKRVRFITSHPKDLSAELISLFAEEPKLCRHIHLPVQSGSDKVLSRMKRGYTASEYLAKANALKGLYGGISITSDVIVGFPGETDEDFFATMSLLNEVRFDNIFSFMYSPRPGTAASGFGDQVPAGVKSERLQTLQEAQRRITEENSRALVGRRMEVLVDGVSKVNGDELAGRTRCNRIVNFPPRAGEGAGPRLMDVVITDAYPNSLRGAAV